MAVLARLQPVLACLLAAPVLVAAAAEPLSLMVEQGGVGVSLRFTPQGEGVGLAEITFTDAASGRALEGARPAAWMVARRSEQVASERSCDDKAAVLMSGSLGARADVDLNGYRLVTLNQDNTLAFINPHVGLQNSKLESIVQLPGTGHDWAYVPRTQRLFVSLRDAGAVAVIDSNTRRLVTTIQTGYGSLPTRLALDEAGRRVWVGLDGSDEVLAMDAASGRELARVKVGLGLHALAAESGSPWLFVTNSHSHTVTLIDRATLRRVADVAVGETPVAMAWSATAQRLAVVSINAGEISLVDPTAGQVSATIALARGIVALGLFDNGRRALVLNGRTDAVSLLDLATARVVAELPVPGRPDQVAFSRDFAYVRSQTSPNVQLISLAQARAGRLQAVAVPIGRSSPADAPSAINVAGVFASAPEGNGMLIANPGDGSVYRYVEGMMVPVGSFSNYRRQARGLRVLDASLVERSPGRFEAAATIERSGRYDLVVRNLRPAVTACFVVDAEAAAAPSHATPTPVTRLVSLRHLDARTASLEFVLADGNGRPLDTADASVLAVQVHGSWQSRTRAVNRGQGRYTATLQGLQAGQFELLARAPEFDVGYERGRLGRLRWPLAETDPDTTGSAAGAAPATERLH